MASKFLLILIAGTLLNPALAEDVPPEEEVQAQEEEAIVEEPSFTMNDENCAFTAKFPEQPFTSKRCNEPKAADLSNARKCYDVVTYTQVYDMMTTVNISLSCNPSSQSAYAQYDERLMTAALDAMARRNALDDSNVTYEKENDIHIAALSGTGQTGRQQQIYVGQLWVAPTSVLSVEAQLIGDGHPEADKAFGEILRSIEVKK